MQSIFWCERGNTGYGMSVIHTVTSTFVLTVCVQVASSYFHDESTNFILFVAISLPVCQVIGAFNVCFCLSSSFAFDQNLVICVVAGQFYTAAFGFVRL